MATLAELKAEIQALLPDNFTYNSLSLDARQSFKALLEPEKHKRFTAAQRQTLKNLYFKVAEPGHPQLVTVNGLLPSHIQLFPVQALSGEWFVPFSIITDENSYGAIFSLLRDVKIKLVRDDEFPAPDFEII